MAPQPDAVGPCARVSIVCLVAMLLIKTCTAQDGSSSSSISSPPIYCLTANETCYSDTTCYPLLFSVSKWCGNYTAGRCSWIKEQHCLSILRTIRNRQPFKDCHCRQEQFDHSEFKQCRQVHSFVQNHPCLELASPPARPDSPSENEEEETITDASLITRTTDENSTACEEQNDARLSCIDARRHCQSQQLCFATFELFREACKHRNDKCLASAFDVQACTDAFHELNRLAPDLFTCRCDDATSSNAERQLRCEKLQRTFRLNPCVQQLIPKCKSRTDTSPANQSATDTGSTSRTTLFKPGEMTVTTNAVLNRAKDKMDCFDVVTECYNNDTCRARLGNMVHACKFSVVPKLRGARAIPLASLAQRCEPSECLTAVAEFYSAVGKKHAHSAAFCTCPSPQNADYPNCIKHLEYLRPPCVFAQDPVPTCVDLLRNCYSRNSLMCRETMKIFNIDCKAHLASHTSDSCLHGVQRCRQAILRMIPRGLITDTCTCDGLSNGTRDVCLDLRSKLFNNTCITEALSITHSISSPTGKLGIAVQHEVSRPILWQLPTGFNESLSNAVADTCSRLHRFSKLTTNEYRLYDRYSLTVTGSGCSEIVRCDNSILTRQPSDRWCEPQPEVDTALSKRNHTAFLTPLASICSNSSIRTPFVIFSSLSQYCVCQFSELVCSTIEARSTDGAVLFHVGYSTTDMNLLQRRLDDIDVEEITEKLAELLGGSNRMCLVQPVWEQVGHVVYRVTPAYLDEEVDGDSGCLNATKLIAQFINQRHPFITHEPLLSVLRSASIQSGTSTPFADDLGAFKRYLLTIGHSSSDDDYSTATATATATVESKTSKKESAMRRKEARYKDEQSMRAASSTLAASFVNLALLTLISVFRFIDAFGYVRFT